MKLVISRLIIRLLQAQDDASLIMGWPGLLPPDLHMDTRNAR